MIGRDHAKDAACRGYHIAGAATFLLAIYFTEYADGRISSTAYLVCVSLLLTVIGLAVLCALPWMALVVADAVRRDDSLTRLSPRPVEGERARLAGAADGQVSALPAAPESSSLKVSLPPGSEAVSPATTVDVAVVAGDASTRFPAPNAGNGPLEC